MGLTENGLGRAGFIFISLYVLDNVYQVILTERPSAFGFCFWKKVDYGLLLLLLNGHSINLTAVLFFKQGLSIM